MMNFNLSVLAMMKTSTVALIVASLVGIALAKPLSQDTNVLQDINAMTNGVEAQDGPAREQGDNRLLYSHPILKSK